MARQMVKIASIVAVTVILLTAISTIVMAETSAAAKAEKWTCNRIICRAYTAQGTSTGKWIAYGMSINVTWKNASWLRFDLNSSVYRYYYIRSQFVLAQ